ncbi:hypothetical protein N0V94_004095 [Neodidymelliopsis sp. IMI 364377]|nr:hypothetical protein N0V94_004095 [Neodidymelliopsis sp. IMI 364377]
MSVSDNSTVAVSHENSLQFKLADDYDEGIVEREAFSSRESPYSGSFILFLDVGSGPTRFFVHSSILEKSSIAPTLDGYSLSDRTILLPELDEVTAHTVIHYLYSSQYEALNTVQMIEPNAHLKRYNLATSVYCAAVRYNIIGLAQVAKVMLAANSTFLTVFDILAVARDCGFVLLPESDTWYPEYIETSIIEAMKQDSEPFRKPDFIAQFGSNSRLLQVIWKTVLSAFAQSPVVPPSTEQTTGSGAETSIAESAFTESGVSEEPVHQLPSPTDSVVNSPPPANSATEEQIDLDPISSFLSPTNSSSDLRRGENESTPQLDDLSNDDFNLPAIEPTTSDHKTTDPVSDRPDAPRESKHVRCDSVLEGEAATSVKSQDNGKEDGGREVGTAVGSGGHEAGKKGKKKGKKRHSSIVFQ